jgi:hypothetical protein
MTNDFNNKIPSETENKEMEKLFLAIYFNDLDKVIEFKDYHSEIYAKKEYFLIDGTKTINLTTLTSFNKIIWNDDDWREELMPLIKKNRKRTKKIFEFWCAEFGQLKHYSDFEYNKYWNYFYCVEPNDTESKDEVIADHISFFLEKGFCEIDLKLYSRVDCFDFAEVKKLLKQGANPNIDFYDDEQSNAISRVATESSYLASCSIVPEFERFEIKGYNQNFDITRMFGDLLGLAAHEKMFKLLKENLNLGRHS